MENFEMGSKKCKGNELELVNPNVLRFSCVSGIEDGNIPEWLLVELLVRLPVKCVFRFKLVCRRWLSVISDPCFVRAYVSRASLLPRQPWTVVPRRMLHKDPQFSHLDYELWKDFFVEPSLCIVGVPSVHRPREGEKYLICGVSNGLVFYWQFRGLSCDYVDHNYYICNPLTGYCIVLPPLAFRLRCCGWGFHTRVEDGVLKSYSVVRLEQPPFGSNRLKIQVYVSEIGEWKDYSVPCDPFPLYIHEPAAVLGGILHWIAKGHGIIAYDPYRNPENVRVIAFSGDIIVRNEFNSLCAEYRGKLGYFEVRGLNMPGVAFPMFKVWVLNDYNSEEWCLLHNICHADLPRDPIFPNRISSIEPMCFHPFDPDIVYLGCDGHCVSYNFKTRELQVEDEFFRHSENVFEESPHWWMYSFLFVIPRWPISVPRPSHGAVEG